MATKPQAKAALDSVVVLIKNDIDTIVPASPTPNFTSATVSIQPDGWVLVLAVADVSAAITLATSIVANLTTASRSSTIAYHRRTSDKPRNITVVSGSSRFRITFP